MFVASTPEECRRRAEAAGQGRSAEKAASPFVVTIGNFDGVHLGHRALIGHTVQRARELGRMALAVTFDPHPARVLSPHAPLALTSTEQRLDLLRDLGVDVTLLVPFTRAFAALSAAEFCRDVLVGGLNADELFVGHDFRMGRDRAGEDELTACGRGLGFRVIRVGAVLFRDEPVSSTRIRNALAHGDLDLANALLGRPYSVRGPVVHGAGRGGPLLGFPTANVEVEGLMMPRPAVYATSARLLTGGSNADMPSVTSFGRNPTFQATGGGAELTLETYLLDFSADIYGETLEISFLKTLRAERKFAGPEELVRQLRADVEERRKLGDGSGRL